MKTNKLLKVSGVLLVLSSIAFALYVYLFYNIYHIYHVNFLDSLKTMLPVSLPLIFISLYCFGLNKTKAGNMLYYIGFGVCLLRSLWLIIRNFTYLNIGTISEYVFLFVLIYFFILKTQNNKSIAVIGIVLLGIYAMLELMHGLKNIMCAVNITCALLLALSDFSKIIALILIWWSTSKPYFTKSNPTVSDLENEIIALNHLYESGAITEQEYKNKRASLLDKI